MQTVERQTPVEGGSFWDRPLVPGFPVSRELALYALLVVVAASMRFWDLGLRMLHHDESLHATYSYYLYSGRGYRHDPMMHGPWQFTIMAFSYLLFGVSEAAARVPHAIFGTVLAVLPFFIRKYIGRTGAYVAGVFLALSPSFLYFTRFAREDAFVVTWTAIIAIAMLRFLDTRSSRDLYILAAALSLGFSTKENTYITAGIILSFLFVLSIVRHRAELLKFLSNPTALSPEGDLVVCLTALILPLFSAFVLIPLRMVTGGQSPVDDQVLVVTLGVLAAVSVLIGMRWDRFRWVRAAAIFWGIFLILHTTFLSNPGGVYSGTIGALKYWIDQQGVARGGQPWYYYLVIVPLYEFVIVTFGLVGIVYWGRKLLRGYRSIAVAFFIWWIFASQVIYAYTSEKMPWLVLHLALPFALLAGMTVGRLFDSIRWRDAATRGAAAFATLCVVILADLFSLSDKELPIGKPLSTIAAQQALFQWLGMVIILAILAGIAVHYVRRLGGAASGQLATISLLAVMMVFSIHTAWQAAYINGDVPVEMLVYTQTTRDVGRVLRQIDDLAYRTGAGKDTFKVAYDSGVSWPFEFYLRDYKARNFYGNGTPAPDAPVVIASTENNTDQRIKQFLGSKYVGQKYRLRAWFDESDYRAIGSDPAILWRAIVNPDSRDRLRRFLLYRDPLKPGGSTDFYVFVRRDLASGPWAAPQTVQQTADEDQYAAKTRTLAAVASFGGTKGAEAGQLSDPKGVAIGPDGSLYVSDAGNNRVVKLDSAGKFVTAWGSVGQGDGQFQEPWGIAVDKNGTVYVADTWNHRIQLFDPQGKQLGTWGGPGKLFGPRAIAITAKGEVLVTDAGNHRVVVYDSAGNQVTTFGGRGAGDGLFSEPIGLAIDKSGNVYVADTWNHRIQKFDSSYKFLAQWPIVGWESDSILNKPFLAIDADGNIYATDPEGSRIIKFSGSGALQTVWGKLGGDTSSLKLPLGIAVDDSGAVLVVDSQNSRVQKFGPVR